jgi:WD40 repeat protein
MWDTREGVRLPDLLAGVAEISALAMDRRRRHLAAGDASGRIWLFALESRSVIGSYEGHAGAVTSLAFDQDNHALVSGGADTTVLTWDLENS